MKAAIVIPTHNRNYYLSKTLDSLSDVNFDASIQGIWVIENGIKTNECKNLCSNQNKRVPVYYRYVEKKGKSNALNVFVNEIKSYIDFIIFFDDDIYLTKDVLIEYISAAKKYGIGYYFGGPTDPLYESINSIDELTRKFLPGSAKPYSLGSEEKRVFKEFFLGFNWAAFTKDIINAGWFDERFGPGSTSGATGQETNMQMALVNHNCRGIYLPQAKVSHVVSKECLDLDWIVRRQYKNSIGFGLNLNINGSSIKVYGVPLWILKRYIVQYILYNITLLTFDYNKIIEKKIQLYKIKGVMHGIKLQNPSDTF